MSEFETWEDVLDWWAKNNFTPEPRWVVSAAVKTECGKVISGARHGNCYWQIRELGLKATHAVKNQGFIDQFNIFMSRQEAHEVAKANDQLIPDRRDGRINESGTLFSEDLY